MKTKYLVLAGVAAVAMTAAAGAADRRSDETPYSTPPGLTLIDVVKIVDAASNQFLWKRLGDANGKPLYTLNDDTEIGKSKCVADCAKEFPPFPAPAGTVATGDWSIVNRPDGIKQLSYQNRPLYYYSGQDPVGEPAAINTASLGADNPAFLDPGSEFFSPKKGWRRAAFTPEMNTPTPGEMELVSIATANGYGLIDPLTRKSVYALKTPPKNPKGWTPVYAPGVAIPIGDFSVVEREDGTRQWSYKNKPLYTYTGDYSLGDMNGLKVEQGAQVALVYKHFLPAEIGIRVFDGRPPLMVDKNGMSVYTQSRQHLQYGGRETRDGYRYHYTEGKAVGTRGCIGECLQTWKPILAPANAKSWGYWEVAARDDGSRQWSYKGSPLYTYAGDKKPGDVDGNSIHDIIYGDPEGKVDLTVTGGDVLQGKNRYGSGFYWHLAGLFY